MSSEKRPGIGRSRLVQKLFVLGKYRWLFAVGISLFVILYETITHATYLGPFTKDYDFWFEALSYGIISPLLLITLFSLWELNWKERTRVEGEMGEQDEFTGLIMGSSVHEELLDRIAQIPTQIFPVASTLLYLYRPEEPHWSLAKAWYPEQEPGGEPQSAPPEQACPCPEMSAGELRRPNFCPQEQHAGQKEARRYCLPLWHKDQVVGLLQVEVAPGGEPDARRLQLLDRIAPQMAMALYDAGLQQTASHQAEVIHYFQRQISRDLHDTLGQSLALLRIKLDILSSTSTLNDLAEIRLELGNMRKVADEAYQQMRHTLNSLQPVDSYDLTLAVSNQAKAIENRSGIKVVVKSDGEPLQVPLLVQRQILYICREVLNNIEKHAGARYVLVHLGWEAQELRMLIRDDGCGFDPEKSLSPKAMSEHLGLAIMRERAEEIHGLFEIHSAPGFGTTVELQLPIFASSSP